MCLCDFKMCGSEKVPVGYRLGRGKGMSHVDAWVKLTPGRAKAYAKPGSGGQLASSAQWAEDSVAGWRERKESGLGPGRLL